MPRRVWSLADRLIVRALTLTMDTAGQASWVAQRLRDEARGNRAALDRAVMRMRRTLYERPSLVGEQALTALLAAAAMTASDNPQPSSTDSSDLDDRTISA